MLEQGYDFYLADTDEGKSIHYHLRYQVYCLREKYENPNHHQNFLEQDEYDNSSVHFIVRSRTSGEWLGAMRLVIGAVQKLPVSKISSVDPANFSGANWMRVAEASRLCTLLPTPPRPDFASKPGAEDRARSFITEALQSSWITVGLIRAVREYSLAHGILHCFFLVSDPLARILRRIGMEIEPVGSPCLHRGWRRPYMHNFKTGYEAMRIRSPELYKIFCRPSAYGRYSELEQSSENLLLAASGSDIGIQSEHPVPVQRAKQNERRDKSVREIANAFSRL